MKNLTGRPLRGAFALELGLASQDRAYDVQFRWRNEVVGQVNKWGGNLWSAVTRDVEVPPGEHTLDLAVLQPAGFQAFILNRIVFQPAGASERASAPAAAAPAVPPKPAAPAPDAGPVLQWKPPS